MKIGYFLSSEEWGPHDLVAQAIKAHAAGFDGLWISDHYHPWNDEQGHSPFVWSTIGVHRLWPNEGLPGELAQILPTPAHFEQASQLAQDTPCGPDVDRHVEAIKAYEQAGFDELYVNQIGAGQDAFFEAYRDEVLPRLDR